MTLLPFTWTPYPWQSYGIDWIVRNERCILADEAGAGKTIQALAAAEQFGAPANLVITPNNLTGQWAKVTKGALLDVRGDPKTRQRLMDSVPRKVGRGMAINYESAKIEVDYLMEYVKGGTLILDEAHYLKNHQSQNYKQMAKLARRAKYVILLTGTPILNHPEELWTLLNLCDPQEFRSYWRWAEEHFHVETTDFHGKLARPTKIVGDLLPGAAERLRDSLGEYLLYRPNLLDLPEVEALEYRLEMSEGERTAYDELVRRHWTLVKGKHFLQTSNEVGRLTRLRQLSSGWATINEELGLGTKAVLTRRLAMRLVDQGQKVLIVTAFKPTAAALWEDLAGIEGMDPVYMTGDNNDSHRKAMLKRFTEGDANIMVATAGIITEGIDGLQGVCADIILHDRDWTPSRNEQVVARLRRIGQYQRVRVHLPILLDTVDETVVELNATKRAVIEEVLL